MDVAHELHRQQLIKAYNNAVKRKDWQAARNYRDELNVLIAKKVALSWIVKLFFFQANLKYTLYKNSFSTEKCV